ncbi:DUF4270 family protein [Chryseolinea sp. T2]|uniref:DUF4270 family protein n=1 Tax=Chryseolinea sp. T2 TaxID=3129255 RepID=UPI003FCDB12D
MLRDSLRTSNFSYNGEPNRLLVGTYQDDRFGTVGSNAVTQYFPVVTTKLPAAAVYDSVSLQLQFDLYHYGSTAKSSQSVSVYKLEEVIKYENIKNYFNKTGVTSGELLGKKSFTVDTEDFDEFAKSTTDYDTVITIKIPLNEGFGRELFSAAVKWRDYATPADSLFIKYSAFIEVFKGLIIKPEASDKALGFNPSAVASQLQLHYHTATDTTSLNLGLSGVISFNQITGDRSATELAQIQEYHQPYFENSETRYIQSGTGIFTKVDFSKFFEYIDTIPNLMINTAELVVENVESGSLPPPPSLALRVLNPNNNRFRRYSADNNQDSIDMVRYYPYLTYDVALSNAAAFIDNDNVFYIHGDKATTLAYSSTKRNYSGVFTLLIQKMTIRNDDRTRLLTFLLYPGSDASTKPAFTSGAKSLNRAIFPRSGIKLRISYTKPLDLQ